MKIKGHILALIKQTRFIKMNRIYSPRTLKITNRIQSERKRKKSSTIQMGFRFMFYVYMKIMFPSDDFCVIIIIIGIIAVCAHTKNILSITLDAITLNDCLATVKHYPKKKQLQLFAIQSSGNTFQFVYFHGKQFVVGPKKGQKKKHSKSNKSNKEIEINKSHKMKNK